MKISKEELTRKLMLYAVTDKQWLGVSSFEDTVHEAISGGVTFLQLREKGIAFGDFFEEAKKIKRITDGAGIPFVINDNVDVAVASGADGVHIGQGDMSTAEARRRIGPDKILGVSAQTVEQARAAEREGADYIGVGAVFTTKTKTDADHVSVETLRSICSAVSIPVVAIGGINRENVHMLSGSGISGIAVISAIFAQRYVGEAARDLAERAREVVIPWNLRVPSLTSMARSMIR